MDPSWKMDIGNGVCQRSRGSCQSDTDKRIIVKLGNQ